MLGGIGRSEAIDVEILYNDSTRLVRACIHAGLVVMEIGRSCGAEAA